MARLRKLFVSLPLRDLARSMEFFTKLGFEFDPTYTDDKAACMVINQEANVMLLTEPFFRTFTRHQLCDTRSHTEGLLALTCESREEVARMVERAIAAGGKPAMDATDHGFMYAWSFYDLDDHHWEVLWMDPQAMPN